ncbi:hypothetical protein BDZ91DRAFT_711989 [Kalaharituber pfeilii]|nr:hypothetical protein BDZ91DRAFT_711989 [Kalaharituber pfeilii]
MLTHLHFVEQPLTPPFFSVSITSFLLRSFAFPPCVLPSVAFFLCLFCFLPLLV